MSYNFPVPVSLERGLHKACGVVCPAAEAQREQQHQDGAGADVGGASAADEAPAPQAADGGLGDEIVAGDPEVAADVAEAVDVGAIADAPADAHPDAVRGGANSTLNRAPFT